MRRLAIFLQFMLANSFSLQDQKLSQLLRGFSHNSENTGSKIRQENTKTTQNWHREPQAYLQLLFSDILLFKKLQFKGRGQWPVRGASLH